MRKSLYVTAAALIALTVAAAAPAAPAPTLVSAAYATVDGKPGTELHVSWALGLNEYEQKEYACVLYVHTSELTWTRVTPGLTATAATVSVLASPGATITVELITTAVLPSTPPENIGCGERLTRTVTLTAPAAPAPPPPPPTSTTATTTEPTSTTSEQSSTSTASPAPDLSAEVRSLGERVAALEARGSRTERAIAASWDALVEALGRGVAAWEAALTARSAALNELYGLTP